MLRAHGRVEEIVLRRLADGTVEVLTTPTLSAITPQALDQLDPRFRDPKLPGVLRLAPHARYLVGEIHARTGMYLLHRIP